MKSFHLYTILALFLLCILAGCSNKKVVGTPVDSATAQSTTTNSMTDMRHNNEEGYSEDNLGPIEESLDDSSGSGTKILAPVEQSPEYLQKHGRSTVEFQPVFFTFDQTGISPTMQEVILANSEVMKKDESIKVVIEGNTDDRGTNEYNMALGEKRAINVAKYLLSLGIDKSRIRTISLGEERPLFPESTEEAYRYNRRADFVVEK